jgi:integrase
MTSVPIGPRRPDPSITDSEREMLLRAQVPVAGMRNHALMAEVAPLLGPVRRTLEAYGYGWRSIQISVIHAIIDGTLDLGTIPQSWSIEQWDGVRDRFAGEAKLPLTVCAVRGYSVPLRQGSHVFYNACHRVALARRLYGRQTVDQESRRIRDELARIGYSSDVRERLVNQCVAELLLSHDAPSLNVVTDESLAAFAGQSMCLGSRKTLRRVSIAMAELGIVRRRLPDSPAPQPAGRTELLGVDSVWLDWCERWKATSPRSESTRRGNFAELMTAGRWLARCHPSVTSPVDWTMDLALDYVRYVAGKCVGDDIVSGRRMARQGEPLSPGGKVALLSAIRTFFHDLQDWEWIKRRFNPNRGFVVPKQVMRALDFKPRPIDEGFWLKLRAASLALRPDDLPEPKRVKTYLYPFELAQAVAVTWTFSGCRLDEIVRLEVGCTYVEHLPEQADPASGEIVAAFDQHMLRVPVNKTRGEFVKPIEEPMARVIAAWERVRPPQRQALDRTTGRYTDHLFFYRGQQIGKGFVNAVVIPILLKKAGLPPEDTRGAITSHRARATLATRLYNSSSGLTALEVMRWLGHTRLSSSQHYVELTPTRLMTAFHRSAKLAEAVRCVSVVIDRMPDATTPVFHYDLGHGWCTNDAYAACIHRMACARCSFYQPAEAFADALAKQGDRYVRMLQELTLTEDERAATTGDAQAVKGLLLRLAKEPIPGGSPALADSG